MPVRDSLFLHQCCWFHLCDDDWAGKEEAMVAAAPSSLAGGIGCSYCYLELAASSRQKLGGRPSKSTRAIELWMVAPSGGNKP